MFTWVRGVEVEPRGQPGVAHLVLSRQDGNRTPTISISPTGNCFGERCYVMKSSRVFSVAMVLACSMSSQILAQSEAKGDLSKDPKTVSVTGCLAESDTPGVAKQFIIKSGDLSYALEAGTENLSAHLGHKVTISGTSMKGKGPHDDDRISVTKVTMVSATCL